jgi:hypothetical protein
MATDSAKWIKAREGKLGWSKCLSSKQNQVVKLHSGPILHWGVKGNDDDDDDKIHDIKTRGTKLQIWKTIFQLVGYIAEFTDFIHSLVFWKERVSQTKFIFVFRWEGATVSETSCSLINTTMEKSHKSNNSTRDISLSEQFKIIHSSVELIV